jgi:hypothetical protein
MDTDRANPPWPAWLGVLDEEDLRFLRRFLLSSGSLKAMAQEYGVSYPTVRSRLEDPEVHDPFDRTLRLLIADGKLAPTVAKDLHEAHRRAMKGAEDR